MEAILNPVRKSPVISSPVLAVIIFILTEIMFFASFISAFTIVKSSFSNWPPMGQPRLPIEATAINSCFLFASAWVLMLSLKYFKQQELGKSRKLFLSALLLGLLFVFLQGMEWVRLIGFGLTMTSSIYGSFFYLLVGGHAIHVLGAAIALAVAYIQLRSGKLKQDSFTAVMIFWFFVVGLWPILYALIYL